MAEVNNLLVRRQRERELKQHQDRMQNMKPCVDSKLGVARESVSPETKRPVRVRIDKGTEPTLLQFSVLHMYMCAER